MDFKLGRAANDIWFVSPSRGFLLGAHNSIFQSQDSGKTWSEIPGTAAYLKLYVLFFVNQQYGFAMGATDLLLTRDAGASWSAKPLPPVNTLTGVEGYAIFFTSPSTGYFGSNNNGLYKTTDTGTTWLKVFADGSSNTFPYFSSYDTGFVVSTGGTVATTSNAGSDWTSIPNDLGPPPPNEDFFNQLQFVNPLVGYYARADGLHKTSDGGRHWISVFSPGEISTANLVKFFDEYTGYLSSVHSIYKTVNGGESWSLSCSLGGSDAISGMYFIDEHTGWACTSQGYVLRLKE
jgi:photosystem II stability/assembly factor-like uncharacterized protein